MLNQDVYYFCALGPLGIPELDSTFLDVDCLSEQLLIAN